MTAFGPWYFRFFAVLFLLLVARTAPTLALVLIIAATAIAVGQLLHTTQRIPGFIMDVLDRLTDKHALEKDYEARSAELSLISAEDLAASLKARLIGQNEAIDSIARQLRRRLAARRKDKPVAVFCLAGPPGVGKTYLGKLLAEALFGDPTHLHFFDMSQFGQAHAAASLFGAARGYVGSQSYGALTSALRDTPDAVVLLDEFEKAHPDVHKRFLTAWNDGFVTEASDGARVPTSEAIFILTTNAASRRIGELAEELASEPEELARRIKMALAEARFAPEVLSRIDEGFAFRPLRGLDVARVVALEMEALIRQYGLEIAAGGIDPDILLDAVQTFERRADGGVRDIARAIERQVTDAVLDARADGARAVRLVADGERVRVEAVDAAPATPLPAPDAA